MSLTVSNMCKAKDNSTTKVTREEFDQYRKVQYEGMYNMLDMGAERATGLSSKKYLTCIQFYAELTKLHGEYIEE